jgi:hypothetical protein
MPEISRFFGLIISMYHDDHLPLHFHVKYAEHRAQIIIETLEVLEGKLPNRVWHWHSNGQRSIALNCERIGNARKLACRLSRLIHWNKRKEYSDDSCAFRQAAGWIQGTARIL